MNKTCLVLCVWLLNACTGQPDGVTVIKNINANKYLGKWYEIARLDHSFEQNLQQVTATYNLRKDGGIRVINRGFNTKTKRWKEVEGKAYFIEASQADNTYTGRLKVSFFGPFYGAYNIIALDKPDYNYVMICGPNKSYLWILSRRPTLAYPIKQRLIAKAKASGFAVGQLISVEQTLNP